MKNNVKLLSIYTLLVMSMNACTSNAAINESPSINNEEIRTTSNKQITSEKRPITSFSSMEVSTGIDVVYYPTSEKPYVEVYLDAPNMQELKTEVSGGKLRIFFKNTKEGKKRKRAEVVVHGPIAKAVEANAGASIRIEGELTVKGDLNMETSAGASIVASKDIVVDGKLDIEASAGSNIRWDKKISAKEADIEASAGSSIKGAILIVEKKSEFDVSSASKCNIANITTSILDIDASTSSQATFSFGQTRQMSIDASTASTVDVSNIVNKGDITIDKSTGANVKAPR